MEHWVLCNTYGTGAITLKWDMGILLTKVTHEGPKRRTREGGSEWESIKNLLKGDEDSNKMNTASNTRLRLTTQIGHVHVATRVLLNLGTNFQPLTPENAAEHQPRVHLPTPV
jgi:hypothetical protein